MKLALPPRRNSVKLGNGEVTNSYQLRLQIKIMRLQKFESVYIWVRGSNCRYTLNTDVK